MSKSKLAFNPWTMSDFIWGALLQVLRQRLDIKAGGFWVRGVTAFFDVRVTHVNSKCYQSKPTSEVFKEQEEEKKRKYQQRVLDVEMGFVLRL